MRVSVLAFLLYLLLIISGCKYVAYTVVATDVKPSIRNNKILMGECAKRFPVRAPDYIRGKDSVRIDTAQPKEDKRLEDVVKTIAGPLNIDSLTALIRASIPPVYIDRHHYRVDTVREDDSHKIKLVQEQLRESEKNSDKLENKTAQLTEDLKLTTKELSQTKRRQILGYILLLPALIIGYFFKKFTP